MSTVQQLLKDIDLRYRNTFTIEQKVFWMNQVQRYVYMLVNQNRTPPYGFETVAGEPFYPLPDNCEAEHIQEITIQINDNEDNPQFDTLNFKQLNEEVFTGQRFYSLVERNLFLYPKPKEDGRVVYVYYQKNPKEISVENLNTEPDLGDEHEELLILGTLERIAAARKDAQMKSNFAADYELAVSRYQQNEKRSTPDFVRTNNVIPWRRGRVRRTVMR